MKKTLEQESDGVAIAAPQIGISFRIFVLSPKIFEGKKEKTNLLYISTRRLLKHQKNGMERRRRVPFSDGSMAKSDVILTLPFLHMMNSVTSLNVARVDFLRTFSNMKLIISMACYL